MSSTRSDPLETVHSLHAEEASVAVSAVERGAVQVSLRTVEREQTVEFDLARERIEVERVAIGRQVEAAPPVRQEGDTTVISVVEEEVVVQRRLILKEEVRLRRVRTTERRGERVTLREQVAEIERTDITQPKDQES